jgi:hypothetical protein
LGFIGMKTSAPAKVVLDAPEVFVQHVTTIVSRETHPLGGNM